MVLPDAFFALLALFAAAADEDAVNYEEHVAPIFGQRCTGCHDADKRKGGLDLSSYRGALAGGSGGEELVAGDPDSSRLLRFVRREEQPFMPPSGRGLSAKEIDVLRAWIENDLLERKGGSRKERKKVRSDLNFVATPSAAGAAILPEELSLEPAFHGERAGATQVLAASPVASLVAFPTPGQVLLYDLADGTLLGVLPIERGRVADLRFSRDGALLLVAGGVDAVETELSLFDVRSGRRVWHWTGAKDAALSADLSSDGRRVAFGGPDRRVWIVDVASGEVERRIEKHSDWVTAVRFSPDGVLLASGDRNGALEVWETQTGLELHALENHDAAVTQLAFRADSNVLASASEDGTVRCFEMFQGARVNRIAAHAGGVRCVDFAPDGRLVSGGRDNLVKVWNPDGKPSGSPVKMADVVLATVFDHEGGRVIAGDWQGNPRVLPAGGAEGGGTAPIVLGAQPPSLAQRRAAAEARLAEARAIHAERRTELERVERETQAPRSRVDAEERALAEASRVRDESAARLAALGARVAEVLAEKDAFEAEFLERAERAEAAERGAEGVREQHRRLELEQEERARAVEALRDLARRLERALADSEDRLLLVPTEARVRDVLDRTRAHTQLVREQFETLRREEVDRAVELVETAVAAGEALERAAALGEERFTAERELEARSSVAAEHEGRLVAAEADHSARERAVTEATERLAASRREGAEAQRRFDAARAELGAATEEVQGAQFEVARWIAEERNVERLALRDALDREREAQSLLQEDVEVWLAEEQALAVEHEQALQVAANEAPEAVARARAGLEEASKGPERAGAAVRAAEEVVRSRRDFLAQMEQAQSLLFDRASREKDNPAVQEAAANARELLAALGVDVATAQEGVSAAQQGVQEAVAAVQRAEQAVAAALAEAEEAQAEVRERAAKLEEVRARRLEADELARRGEERVAELSRRYELLVDEVHRLRTAAGPAEGGVGDGTRS